MGPCKATCQIDNASVRVTKFDFAPGEETEFHRHEMDYVIIPITDGELKLIDATGQETMASLTAGQPYFRQEGVEHNVINASQNQLTFIEVELKG